MSKLFMPDATPEQRIAMLEQNAFSVEETDFLKPLTPEELDIRREQLTTNFIDLIKLEDDKKIIVDEFKQKMDPLTKENRKLATEVNTRQAKCYGKIYMLQNHEDSMMETYDDNGELIMSRRLRPEEKQGTVFSLRKAQ